MVKRYTIAMIECKKHRWAGNGVMCPECERSSKHRNAELAAERAAAKAKQRHDAPKYDTSDWQVPPMPEKELRAQLEKVRDKISASIGWYVMGAKHSGYAAAHEALRMLEAILEGKEP